MADFIGRYRITGKLGEGGMGVVFSALDDQLQRPVAIKMVRESGDDDGSRQRLRREARSAAAVSHPNVCQLYEIGEEQGKLFIVMELLDGESLASRLAREPLALPEAVQVALAVLAALEALHGRGIIHRDLKPSNVYLTPHAVKLLDFGLALPVAQSVVDTSSGLAQPGAVVGTPQYMAPEQIAGKPVDARIDLFATGAMLYEMLTGQCPFAGRSLMEILHAVVYEQAPVLGGSPAIAAVDRVIHRALAKNPEDRYQTARSMAQDLREALLVADSGEMPRARPMSRLVVLPFRMLRPDPEIDFLAFSLPDAITSSLSGLESLIVRSSVAASRFAVEAPVLKSIAEDLEVDIILTGSLLRAGGQIRVSTQLVEVPSGTLVWTHTAQVLLGDIFQLQDELAHGIVASLSLPLTAREHRMLKHDVPASAKAYEFYLRANQLSYDPATWTVARDLYLRCVEEDPRYAPGWARLGRIHRVIAKFVDEDPAESMAQAEACFQRALEFNPELAVAHSLYAQLEVDLGRARDAMVRLLEWAQKRSGDPQLFAGLVHACRYCGLLEASAVAHEQARRLDPQVPTSVAHTYWALGDYSRALEAARQATDPITGVILVSMGRKEEAVAALKRDESRFTHTTLLHISTAFLGMVEGDREKCLGAAEQLLRLKTQDPERMFYIALMLAAVGAAGEALSVLKRALDEGFSCFPVMARTPWLDPLRADPGFRTVLRKVEQRHKEAVGAFLEAGGDHILGLAVERFEPEKM